MVSGVAIFTSTVVAAIIITLGCVVLSVGGFLLVVKLAPGIRKEHNNDLTSLVFGVVSALYAILLAFVVVIVWQEFTAAQTDTEHEITRVRNLIRDAGAFPDGPKLEIRQALIKYADLVATREWDAMAHGEADAQTGNAYAALWDKYYNFTPKGDTEKPFYSASVDRLNEIGETRRLRLLSSRAKVPMPLWILMIAGGVVTIALTYLFWARSIRTQALVIGALGALLGFVFFLIFALEHPFKGDIRISPQPFSDLVKEWPGGRQVSTGEGNP